MKGTLITVLALVFLLSASASVAYGQDWDFPRLGEIIFKVKYPATVSLEAAKACEIDTYVGAVMTIEVEELKNDPYYWSVTAAPGFHMCYIGINCRDVTPETSGARLNYHDRTPGFQLYPLNLSAFRYALELICGDDKDAWLNDVYGYVNSRLDTVVPPANVYWYNPEISQYPKNWTLAAQVLHDAGFTGTICGNDWVMPDGTPLNNRIGNLVTGEKAIHVMAIGAPTSVEISRRHVLNWNLFFCNQSVADPPHTAIFKHEFIDFFDEIDIAFYNRDHDIYFNCWGLSRNPDYLWWFFHPETDVPDWNNSPGLDYRPLNILIKSLYCSRWDEYFEKEWIGPGPSTVSALTTKPTKYAFVSDTEELWIGVDHASPGLPWYLQKLARNVDYQLVLSAGNGVGIRFLRDIILPDSCYVHMVYTLVDSRPINAVEELRQICWDAQWILYYACPYLPIYSRNYHDLFKPGLTNWVPSQGFGAASYQLKWTYGNIHWSGMPVSGTVNWHLPGPVSTLHPWLSSSTYEKTILNRLYDSMVEVDAYSHEDIPWLALHWKLVDWTGPSGEPGMEIQYWIRNDIKWQDGDHVTADDFVWQYDFINSTRPSQLSKVWSTYHGCTKYSDYCFGIRVNVTGWWGFRNYTMGLVYPKKVWLPYYGNKAAAEAFTPWTVPHPNGTIPWSLYGTSEWLLYYFNSSAATVELHRNPYWWGMPAAFDSRQMGDVYTPTTTDKDGIPKATKTLVGLHMFNLDAQQNWTSTWTLKIDGVTVNSSSLALDHLQSASWSQPLSWRTLSSGLHTFQLEISNAAGTTTCSAEIYVLIGDVDDSNIVDMLDLYKIAIVFGATAPPCNLPEDIDSNGVVNMLDLYICAINFGAT